MTGGLGRTGIATFEKMSRKSAGDGGFWAGDGLGGSYVGGVSDTGVVFFRRAGLMYACELSSSTACRLSFAVGRNRGLASNVASSIDPA